MGTLTDKWTPAARRTATEFGAWMEREGLSQPEARTVLGVSQGTLNAMLHYKYPGNVAGICEQMERVLRRARLRALAPTRPPYVTTSVTEEVVRACQVAHVERVIALVMGPSGIGKTVGLRRYCDQEPEAIYVAIGTSATPWAICDAIAEAGGLKVHRSRGAARIRRDVIAALRGNVEEQQRGALLILDEMDYPSEPPLQTLRLIYDETGIGQVWCGTAVLLDRVRGSGSPTRRQITRRIRYAPMLRKCSGDDLERILEYYELPEDVMAAVVEGAGGEADRAISAVVAARRIVGRGRDITVEAVARGYRTLPPQDL